MKPETLKAIVLIAVAAALFGGGWAVEGWRMGAEMARLEKARADEKRAAAERNASELAAANRRADAIALRLAGWENTLTTFAQEKDREIERLTTGRRCLDSAAVRVLNRPNGLKQPGVVPEAIGEPVRTDAAFATDTDVGTWIGQCQRSYDTCRARIDAIAEFYAGDSRASE